MHAYITLHYITLHYITLHYITLHYITLHYITLHYITYIHTRHTRHTRHTCMHTYIHYITLHYITLHYTTLHYITVIHTYIYIYTFISTCSTVANQWFSLEQSRKPPQALKYWFASLPHKFTAYILVPGLGAVLHLQHCDLEKWVCASRFRDPLRLYVQSMVWGPFSTWSWVTFRK